MSEPHHIALVGLRDSFFPVAFHCWQALLSNRGVERELGQMSILPRRRTAFDLIEAALNPYWRFSMIVLP